MSDAYSRREQIFPRLSAEQIETIRPFGRAHRAAAGEVLFEQGQEKSDFVVVLSGRLEIVQPRGADEERITIHEPGEFTGEVAMFSGQRSLVRGRVLEAGEMLVVPRAAFRRLAAADAELGELFMRAFVLRRLGLLQREQGALMLVGSLHSAETLRIRRFLSRHGQPHRFLDVDTDAGAEGMLRELGVAVEQTPILVAGTQVLRAPSERQIADLVGLSGTIDPEGVEDVVIVGAGPAGLAAAVYAASEGLSALVLEAEAPGGQAGTSSRIENYLGFPTGISGQDLAARALNQAQKFGARLFAPRRAVALDASAAPYRLILDEGEEVRARTLVIASGARYRRLPIADIERFEGSGVYYGATLVEAHLCGDEEVTVVGGGNSAGQAAVFLSRHARHVHVLVRRDGLSETMSRYLIERIESSARITLHTRAEVVGLAGEGRLEEQTWRIEGKEQAPRRIPHLFVMIGADPNTEWLEGVVARDARGFLLTGGDVPAEAWPLARPASLFETSCPRVFAVGDVRASGIKRVASAVGDGSMCIRFVHQVLDEVE